MEAQEKDICFLSLKILTEDKKLAALVADYWKLDFKRKPVYGATILREKYELGKGSVLSYISGMFEAYDPSNMCETCKNPVRYLTHRDHIDWKKSPECYDCFKYKIEEERLRNEDEKVNNLRIAFDNLAHHRLNQLELKFFQLLAKSKNVDDTASRMCMSITNGRKVIDKLKSLNLLTFLNNKLFVLPEYEELLTGLNQEPVTSIFGPNNYKLYQYLKNHHLFVFPEVALASFVVDDQVKHLFTEPWHASYFLKCRIDALITEPNGWPIHAVELQTSGHLEEHIKQRDAFKKLILINAGIPISYYRLFNGELKLID